VLYGPTSFPDLVKHSIDNADFAYIDDIFAEPDPHFMQVARQKRMNLFSAIFQRIDESVRKLESFTIESVEGFQEIENNFFKALEQYPSFLQQITSLTMLNFGWSNAERYASGDYTIIITCLRILKHTTSLRTLTYQAVGSNHYMRNEYFPPVPQHLDTTSNYPHLTSLTILHDVVLFEDLYIIGTSTSLQSLSLQNCSLAYPSYHGYIRSYRPTAAPLTYLGLSCCALKPLGMLGDSDYFLTLLETFTNLRTLELKHSIRGRLHEFDPAVIQDMLPGINVIGAGFKKSPPQPQQPELDFSDLF
jgi:hypothetical protein